MSTYFTYNEGVEAKHLHLGNLVHDYKHPNELEPYVEKAYTDISEPPPDWAQSGSLENYALTLGKASKQAHDFEDNEDEGGIQGYRVVAAAKTTRVEIKDPEEFFNEHTLTSNEAKKWLSSHLSAAESLAQGKPGPRPQIWLLTGLILMQHATWTRLSSKDKRFVAGERAPFIPAGVSAIRRSSVSDAVKPTFGYRANEEEKHIPGGHVIHETGKYPGTRAWAAQWQRVDVKITSAKKDEDVASNHITLKRAPQLAVVKLREDVHAENEEEEEEEEDENDSTEELDDEYWDSFIDEIDD